MASRTSQRAAVRSTISVSQRLQSHASVVANYECDLCGRRYRKLHGLHQHQVIHAGGERHRCPLCAKVFSRVSSLATHRRHFHELEKRFECDLCGRRYHSLQGLHQHQVIHAGGERHRCPLCAKVYCRASLLTTHRRHFHELEKRFECDLCGRRYHSLQGLHQHQVIHAGGERHRCPLCAKVYSEASSLAAHRRHVHEHVEARRFECDRCGRRFQSAGNLRRHENKHRGERSQRCDICSKTFSQYGSLRKHQRLIHQGERRFECDNCGRRSATKRGLLQHEDCHKAVKTQHCPLCPMRYFSVAAVYQHRRIVHTASERSFMCDACGLRYQTRQELFRHSARHSGCSYACSQCEKRFTRESNLRQHQRAIHQEQRPFVCPQCAKRFHQAPGLQQHLLIHAAINPFACQHCPYKCRQRLQLRSHVSRCHKTTP